jgi:hypothetical protein
MLEPDPGIRNSNPHQMNADPQTCLGTISLELIGKKNKKFFCLLLFEGTFTSFFKDKKSKRSNKTVGIKVFFLFLLDDRTIRIRIYASDKRIRIQEAQKTHTDPTDPDSGSATLGKRQVNF